MSDTTYLTEDFDCEEAELVPQKFVMSVPRPNKDYFDQMEDHGVEVFFTPRVFADGPSITGCVVNITYEDEKGNFTVRKVTVEDYYYDCDAIVGHCHLRKERRKFFVSGLRSVKLLVEDEYANDNGCGRGHLNRKEFEQLCETGEAPVGS
jgi:hypothetical protein